MIVMRRRPGSLTPLETVILDAALSLHGATTPEFHGYQLRKRILELHGAGASTPGSTVYRALERMEALGLLESRWEDGDAPEAEKRPRRRLYSITADGIRTLASIPAVAGPLAFSPEVTP